MVVPTAFFVCRRTSSRKEIRMQQIRLKRRKEEDGEDDTDRGVMSSKKKGPIMCFSTAHRDNANEQALHDIWYYYSERRDTNS
jgi:hypothetical protein